MSALKPVLTHIADGARLSAVRAEEAFSIIMRGEAEPAEIAALLTALRVRGETVEEIAGAVRAMRAAMVRVKAPTGAMDCCGTGGDGAHTLNISTAVALVLAGGGVIVAKHGNRAITSKSGAADVLAALGVPIDMNADAASAAMAEHRFAFLLAPNYHPAMRHVGPVRQALGFRTVFNLLGPLANPAGVTRQLIGAPTVEAARKLAGVLALLGVERAWVVSGDGGLDELSPTGPSHVFKVEGAHITEAMLSPADIGLPLHTLEAIRGDEATINAKALVALLDGRSDAYRDTVVLNAAAAFVVAGKASAMAEGADLAAHSIDSGAAKAVLHALNGVA
jgi:anthranilate phosphoribosyltransferase